ncbi:hypothetical protein TEQG_00029 [Trichophyton equinum CBS 127.97]|uniref:Uncharacterized protein n=1 Tax=Trichophyton equinum (strain ATCC MYA-4606 / CBS 127.97) TaxID=559882 RepID=F2PGF6_TRIEC|nr:hypothetical protein TEQG_00029 [Trichophyton equinum CBS 127.97]
MFCQRFGVDLGNALRAKSTIMGGISCSLTGNLVRTTGLLHQALCEFRTSTRLMMGNDVNGLELRIKAG